jgi:hypothetical protein
VRGRSSSSCTCINTHELCVPARLSDVRYLAATIRQLQAHKAFLQSRVMQLEAQLAGQSRAQARYFYICMSVCLSVFMDKRIGARQLGILHVLGCVCVCVCVCVFVSVCLSVSVSVSVSVCL